MLVALGRYLRQPRFQLRILPCDPPQIVAVQRRNVAEDRCHLGGKTGGEAEMQSLLCAYTQRNTTRRCCTVGCSRLFSSRLFSSLLFSFLLCITTSADRLPFSEESAPSERARKRERDTRVSRRISHRETHAHTHTYTNTDDIYMLLPIGMIHVLLFLLHLQRNDPTPVV